MCKNPGDSNYFQVLREEGDGEEKRSAEKKGVARDGEKKRKREGEGYISSSSGSVKVCWLAIAVGQLILTPDHTPQPALKRQQPEKDTRKGGQDEYRMGMNHCMVRLLLNTVYNLFSESFFSIYVSVGCRLRLIKQVTLWRRTEINCIISTVSQVNKFSVYENVKKFPRAVRAHICAKTQARCEGGVFALETNLQVTSSQDMKPHIQLLLIKKSFLFYRFPKQNDWHIDNRLKRLARWNIWSARWRPLIRVNVPQLYEH